VRLLVRTWNVFHGNASPPEHAGYLEEAVRLITADEPDVVCLQEVPAWGLARLGDWSGMAVYGEVAAPPRLGPFPSTAEVGRRLTRIDQGFLRSAFSGQANAILLGRRLRGSAAYSVQLNSRGFRDAQARVLGLDAVTRLAWAKERRVCHAVRAAAEDGRVFVIANLHATGLPDDRLPDAEALRAASFADGLARPREVCVLAGDFNVWPARSRTLADLTSPAWGFSALGPKLDQVLVRGADTGPLDVWPVERRRVDGRLLSDHAPVEVEVA
jgi:endonuclease/exonuclease/phosphatase family metal-dependent hydrolase